MRVKQTKAELLAMLAEAVRNTQPQQQIGATQPDPISQEQPKLKRKTGPVSKRTTKTKNARTSARRKEQRR
jgi:hypothetical protein